MLAVEMLKVRSREIVIENLLRGVTPFTHDTRPDLTQPDTMAPPCAPEDESFGDTARVPFGIDDKGGTSEMGRR